MNPTKGLSNIISTIPVNTGILRTQKPLNRFYNLPTALLDPNTNALEPQFKALSVLKDICKRNQDSAWYRNLLHRINTTTLNDKQLFRKLYYALLGESQKTVTKDAPYPSNKAVRKLVKEAKGINMTLGENLRALLRKEYVPVRPEEFQAANTLIRVLQKPS